MPKKSKRESPHHGLVVIDKPTGMTSQGVVSAVRRVAGTRRVGHTGTLDPLATGLLLILVGEATKLSEYMVGADKAYEGTMRLGVQSNTYDCQGETTPGPGAEIPDLEALKEATAPFIGDIEQIPPLYSAIKVKGKKLYEYARAGKDVEVQPREVFVERFEVVSIEGDTAKFVVECGSGTYVRSLVHDLGQAIGCGALVDSLRRTAIEDFTLEESVTLEALTEAGPDKFTDSLLPMVDAMTDWPIMFVEKSALTWIARGQAIPTALAQHDSDSNEPRIGELVFLSKLMGDAVAVAKMIPTPPSNPPAQLARYGGPWLQPVKIVDAGMKDYGSS